MPDSDLAAQLDRIEAKLDRVLADRGGEVAEAETRAEAIATELHERAGEMGIGIGAGGLITETDAARLLNLGPSTLRSWRYAAGPELPFSRLGNRVRYAIDDLAAFLATRE